MKMLRILDDLSASTPRAPAPRHPFASSKQQTLYEKHYSLIDRLSPLFLGRAADETEEKRFLGHVARLAEEAVRAQAPFFLRWDVALCALEVLLESKSPTRTFPSNSLNQSLQAWSVSLAETVGLAEAKLRSDELAYILRDRIDAEDTQCLHDILFCIQEFLDRLQEHSTLYLQQQLPYSISWYDPFPSHEFRWSPPNIESLLESTPESLSLRESCFFQFMWLRWLRLEKADEHPILERSIASGWTPTLRSKTIRLTLNFLYTEREREKQESRLESLLHLHQQAQQQPPKCYDEFVATVLNVMETCLRELDQKRRESGPVSQYIARHSELFRGLPIAWGSVVSGNQVISSVPHRYLDADRLMEPEKASLNSSRSISYSLMGSVLKLACSLGTKFIENPRFQPLVAQWDLELLLERLPPSSPDESFWCFGMRSVAEWIRLKRIYDVFPAWCPELEPLVAAALAQSPEGPYHSLNHDRPLELVPMAQSLEAWDKQLDSWRFTVVSWFLPHCNQKRLVDELIRFLGNNEQPTTTPLERLRLFRRCLASEPGKLARLLCKEAVLLLSPSTELENYFYRKVLQEIDEAIDSGDWSKDWSVEELKDLLQKDMQSMQSSQEDEPFEEKERSLSYQREKLVDSLRLSPSCGRIPPDLAVKFFLQRHTHGTKLPTWWTDKHTQLCWAHLDRLEELFLVALEKDEKEERHRLSEESRSYIHCLAGTPEQEGLREWASKKARRACFVFANDVLAQMWKIKKAAQTSGFLELFKDDLKLFDKYAMFFSSVPFPLSGGKDPLFILLRLACTRPWALRFLLALPNRNFSWQSDVFRIVLHHYWKKEAGWEVVADAIREHDSWGPAFREKEANSIAPWLEGARWSLPSMRSEEQTVNVEHWGESHLRVLLQVFWKNVEEEPSLWEGMEHHFSTWETLLKPNPRLFQLFLEETVIGQLWSDSSAQIAEQIHSRKELEAWAKNDIACRWWLELSSRLDLMGEIKGWREGWLNSSTLSPLALAGELASEYQWAREFLLDHIPTEHPATLRVLRKRWWALDQDWQHQAYLLIVQRGDILEPDEIGDLYHREVAKAGSLSPELLEVVEEALRHVPLVHKLQAVYHAAEYLAQQGMSVKGWQRLAQEKPSPTMLHICLANSLMSLWRQEETVGFTTWMQEALEAEETFRQVGRDQEKNFPWLVRQAIWSYILGYRNLLTEAWPEVQEFLIQNSKKKHLGKKRAQEPLAKMLTSTLKTLLHPKRSDWEVRHDREPQFSEEQQALLSLTLVVLSTSKGERTLKNLRKHNTKPEEQQLYDDLLSQFWVFQKLPPRKRMDLAFSLLRVVRYLQRKEQPLRRDLNCIEECKRMLQIASEGNFQS